MVHTTQQNNKASKNRSDEGENDNTEVMKEAQGTMKKTPSSNEVNGGSSSVDNRVDVENQQTPEGEVHGVQEAQDFVGSLPYIDSSRSALSSNATSFNRESTRTSLLTNNQRVSLKMDLETGQKGGSRAQRAMIRNPEDCYAQCRQRRKMHRLKRLSNPFWKIRKDDNHDEEEEVGEEVEKKRPFREHRQHRGSTGTYAPVNEQTQYKLMSLENLHHVGPHFKAIYEESDNDNESRWICGLRPNLFVTQYLFWAFRSSFMAVLLSSAVWFFMLTAIFTLLIFIIGIRNPVCISVGGEDFGEDKGIWKKAMDAYALSWTTFSTVGYGLVHPATSATVNATAASNHSIIKCTGITILCTLESFVGILLASFWGAIFLSKVTRISSFAQVTFSDPIVCRYGSGVGPVEDDDANSSDDGHEKAKKIDNLTPLSQSKLALPVLEFRVLNRLQGQKKGEIIDASMNIVASVDESQVAKSGASGSRIRRGKKGKTRRTVVKKPSKRTEDKPDGSKSQSSLIANLLGKSRRKIPLEDPTRSHMSRKSFAKLEIESQEHPFFKRVWVARHVLDQDSPLLQPGVKELIRLNQGHWPDELNNPEALRASIGFEQILVSLSGTSNADANSVYAQKVYDYVDLCFGYRFCNVLFRDETGLLIVDTTLFNDVVEQDGGGGEDLQNRALDNKMADIFIL